MSCNKKSIIRAKVTRPTGSTAINNAKDKQKKYPKNGLRKIVQANS